MITMLLYSRTKKELKMLRDEGFEVSCRLSDEDWDFESYQDIREVLAFLAENPIIDIALVDVCDIESVDLACRLREKSRSLYIIILTDVSVPPTMYIKPTIMAASLMLRPLSHETIKEVFTEVVRQIIRQRSSGDVRAFTVETRDGKRLIPYEQILFFESRNKKIFVNTRFEEYSFYNTLDEIEKKIGSGFLRCHRSFIIPKSKITKVMLSQNLVVLDGEYQIPLSRSYKKLFKELTV